jgi:arylsulfatase
VFLDNSWVVAPVTKIIDEFQESLKKHPPIEPGTADPYSPNRAKRQSSP